MNKKLTGREFGQREFKKLAKCVECGIACEKPHGSKCDLCISANIPKCKMCDVVLRDDKLYRFFTYDLNEEFGGTYKGFGASNRIVKEFTYFRKPEYHKVGDCICSGCVGMLSNIKDNCYNCNSWFNNSEEHYKNHGNMCPDCVKLF